jgi:DNA-binding NarL/FixJ family response regulator
MPASPSTPAAATPSRIYLVEDHVLVREGLAKLIEQDAGFRICGEAGTASDALSGIAQAQPDAVILDLALGDESGLDLIKRLQDLPKPPPILVLSMHDEAVYATRALRAGARGYVMKRETSGKIIAGLHRILEGHLYVNEKILSHAAEIFLTARPAPGESPVQRLSDRELEIFRRIGLGQENRAIAETLGLSLKTVQTHCAHIKDKLGLPTATLLMREAVRWVENTGAT